MNEIDDKRLSELLEAMMKELRFMVEDIKARMKVREE